MWYMYHMYVCTHIHVVEHIYIYTCRVITRVITRVNPGVPTMKNLKNDTYETMNYLYET